MGAPLALRDVEFSWTAPRAVGGGFSLGVPDFSMTQGETALLLGDSGSGKSTLLSLICGIVTPQKGEVEVDGTRLSSLRASARDRLRGERIGVIFQQFNLLPWASVEDNILLALRFAPARRKRAGNGPAEAARLCAALGLPQGVTTAEAGRLSTGQQQRVAAARALIGAPPLIVADEPASALDASAQGAFLDLLFGQCREAGSTLLMVSHDARIAPRFDRAVNLADIAYAQRSAA
jgi:putative ABC transport system ATP-binding protein